MRATRKLAANTVIQIVSKAIMTLIGLISIRLLTHYLGVDGFGEYTIIITYLTILSVFAELGLQLVLTREIADASQEYANRMISYIYTLRLIAAFLIVGVIGSSLIWVFDYPQQVKVLVIFGSLGTMGMSMGQVLIGVFQTHLRIDRMMIADLMGRTVLMSGIILLVITEWIALPWVIIMYVLAGITHAGAVYFFARTFYRFGLAWDWSIMKPILVQAFPLFIITAFNVIYYRVDTLMISVMESSTEVGLYGASYKILEILVTVPGMFAGLLLPILTRYYNQDWEYFGYIIQKGSQILFALGVPTVIGGIFLSEEILLLIAGEEYVSATLTLQVLFGAIGVIFLSNLLSHVMIASHLQKQAMYIAIIGSVFNVGANLIFIYYYSFLGAAIATVLTEILVFGGFVFFIERSTHKSPRLSLAYCWVIVSSMGMAGTLYILQMQGVHFLIQIPLAALVYGGIFILPGKSFVLKHFALQVREAGEEDMNS